MYPPHRVSFLHRLRGSRRAYWTPIGCVRCAAPSKRPNKRGYFDPTKMLGKRFLMFFLGPSNVYPCGKHFQFWSSSPSCSTRGVSSDLAPTKKGFFFAFLKIFQQANCDPRCSFHVRLIMKTDSETNQHSLSDSVNRMPIRLPVPHVDVTKSEEILTLTTQNHVLVKIEKAALSLHIRSIPASKAPIQAPPNPRPFPPFLPTSSSKQNN